MRKMILLAFAATLAGCQHTQRCTQTHRSMSPFSACNSRDAGNCCGKKNDQPRCDLKTACRSLQSSCQKVCKSTPDLRCKHLGLGWKEFQVPVPQFKDQQPASRRSCKTAASCGSKACGTAPVAGCCQEFPTRPMEATPFLTLPPEEQTLNQQRQTPRWHTNPSQPSTKSTAGLAQRTQVLESQVTEIHSMLQRQPPVTGQTSDYQQHLPAQRQGTTMFQQPGWRTMNGVPPIPNSGIEQTGAFGSTSGTYRTAYDPQMWPHSPQNVQRSMVR